MKLLSQFLAPSQPDRTPAKAQEQGQGNRRLRRAEAKMARKNARKKIMAKKFIILKE